MVERGTGTSGKPPVSGASIFLNAGEFIEVAIESVFAQTHGNWDLLLPWSYQRPLFRLFSMLPFLVRVRLRALWRRAGAVKPRPTS